MIIDKIKERRLKARKKRIAPVASVLAVIIAELDRKQDHSDEACIKVISAALDNNKLALEHAKGDHADILVIENKTLELLLPERMGEHELEAFVTEFVIDNGANHMRFMGQLRTALQATGKVVDMSRASAMFKNAIGM
ncbi:tRNA amidotransferase [Vibrio phage D481]